MFVFLSAPVQLYAQRFTSSESSQQGRKTEQPGDENARQAYNALKAGKLDEARDYLDDADPQDPYAKFVHAALTRDAVSAADMYKEIVAENEGEPIAREALLQLYEYHYAAGDYDSAHQDYLELRKFGTRPDVSDPLGLKDSLQALPSYQLQGPAQGSQPGENVSPQTPTFLVQVGVFTTAENAQKFIQGLRIYGITGTVFKKNDGGRTLYGVSAGSFSSRDAANDRAADLRSRSIDCIVVQK